MALDRQISLFKVDTNAFLTEEEQNVYNIFQRYISNVKKHYEVNGKPIKKDNPKYEEYKTKINTAKTIYKQYILKSAKRHVEDNEKNEVKDIRKLNKRYLLYKDKKGQDRVNLRNVVSMFESTLSRSFGIEVNDLTYDMFIVEIYYYDIAKDIIVNGFDYDNKHYVYFSSSAGQIRTKKAVFVEEQKYNECRNKLMCGLTIDHINEKGGMNINKYLAYAALSNSATDLWKDVFDKEFDIDRTIVVDDFETQVPSVVDYIDHITYEITPNTEMDIDVPHTDGGGMISSDYSKKNFMVRLPFIKGLLGSFDFKRFITENDCSPKVKDIWGKEYDIFEDDIQVIFTKSQFKMWKYYDNWDDYKEKFKKYQCEAGICNLEEDHIPNAKINYQMLQTLYKATDDEIAEMCSSANKKIKGVCDSLNNALEFFGVYNYKDVDDYDDYFQKALKIYPELINDPASKADLHDLKKSYVKRYKSGKLDVIGKFTFVLPDLYAFCEYLFIDKYKAENNNYKETKDRKIPKGLLQENQVYCRLYKTSKELDCLRSPHLYCEHAIRNNMCGEIYCKEDGSEVCLDDWYQTDAIYISTHDAITRILQMDVDGDRLLVLAQRKLIDLAKRCMEGINPLYYQMSKAHEELITPENIYKGLKLAFTGGRIGGISNDITKIWNCGHEISEDEKKAIRWLCMETNFTIDYAKTLYKPERPKEVNDLIKKYTKAKTPYFFRYAKDKDYVENPNQFKNTQVEKINNSVMNKICAAIKENNNMFRPIKYLAPIDYNLMLLSNYSNDEVNKVFDLWNKKYGNNIHFDENDDTNRNNLGEVSKEVLKDLSSVESDLDKVLDSLVKFLYEKPSTRKKKLLWYVFGDRLFNRLQNRLDKDTSYCTKCGRRSNDLINGWCKPCTMSDGVKPVNCKTCNKEFYVPISNTKTKYCDDCKKEYKKQQAKMRVKRYRNNNVTLPKSEYILIN